MSTVEIANVDQANAWDGDDGAHWTEHAARYNWMTRRHNERLRAGAAIGPDDHVLDIGCGSGQSTREAAHAARNGSALGVDLSASQLELARRRAREEGLTNVRFEQADAQVYPFPPDEFTIAISRFGVMFFADQVAAFTNIARALRPGARLALLVWQKLEQNEWLLELRTALAAGRDLPAPPVGGVGPFGLADPDAVRKVLETAGFSDVEFDDVDEILELGPDPDDAFAFVQTIGMARGMLAGIDDQLRTRALDALQASVAAHDTGDGVQFGSRAWMIRAHRA